MQNIFNIYDFSKPIGKWDYALYRPCKMEDDNHVVESSRNDAEFYGIYVRMHSNGLSYHIMDTNDEETARRIVFLLNGLAELYEEQKE